MTLEIRRARPKDRQAVLAFCADTWQGHDYIPRVWDDWLADPEGLLLVATQQGTPVAMARTAFYTPGEAWLEGMRVDPRHRHKGISTALFRAQMDDLVQRGVRVARLVTASDNAAVRRMCARLGFRRLVRIRGRSRLLRAGPNPPAIRPLAPGETTLACTLLERRGAGGPRTPSFLQLTGGLYALRGGLWVSWNERRLSVHLAQGHVWVWQDQGQARAVALITPHHHRQGFWHVGLLEGPAGACSALLKALAQREEMPEEDLEYPPQIRVLLPLEISRLHRAAAAAGYRLPLGWHGEMWLFQWVATQDGLRPTEDRAPIQEQRLTPL